MNSKPKKETLEIAGVSKQPSDYFELRLPKAPFSKNVLLPLLVILLIIASFIIGSQWTRIQYLERNKVAGTSQEANTTAQTPQAVPTEDTSPKKVSVDDDPVLGNEDAPLTIIEFSDYECPFCKRFYEDTLPQLKKEYIDTGKVKLVYRDLPLSFHDPMATLEAAAANCAREQGDDTTYYRHHDEIFTRTKSNGNGLTKDDLLTIASDIGLDTALFTTCLDSDKYTDEIKKDSTDAASANANATPTFFVGKTTTSGIITGTKIEGAQPFSAFKTVIDKQLSQK